MTAPRRKQREPFPRQAPELVTLADKLVHWKYKYQDALTESEVEYTDAIIASLNSLATEISGKLAGYNEHVAALKARAEANYLRGAKDVSAIKHIRLETALEKMI